MSYRSIAPRPRQEARSHPLLLTVLLLLLVVVLEMPLVMVLELLLEMALVVLG